MLKLIVIWQDKKSQQKEKNNFVPIQHASLRLPEYPFHLSPLNAHKTIFSRIHFVI